MNELVTIAEFQKLRIEFHKQTGLHAIKDKQAYINWLELKIVKNELQKL